MISPLFAKPFLAAILGRKTTASFAKPFLDAIEKKVTMFATREQGGVTKPERKRAADPHLGSTAPAGKDGKLGKLRTPKGPEARGGAAEGPRAPGTAR